MKFTILQLPAELVTEILTRAPIKELARCKCVCKSWRSLIRSPQFLQIQRSRDRGLMLYWSESGQKTGEFRFYRLLEDDKEEFSLLRELNVGPYSGECRLVNGLICVHESESGTPSIYSICRGEKMRVPEPPPPNSSRVRLDISFHLGFDPVSKRYKLLRLISPDMNMMLQGHIITLQPSGLVSEWRKLDYDAAGFGNVPKPYIRCFYLTNPLPKLESYSGNGVVCWMTFLSSGVIVFVVEQEKFRFVNLPAHLRLDRFKQVQIFPRAQFRDQRLALSLWIPIEHEGESGDGLDFECFILEDDVGDEWRREIVSCPREVGVSEITLVSSDSYWDRIVKIPAALRGSDEEHSLCQHSGPLDAKLGFCTRLSYLPNRCDHFNFSLDDLLCGRT